jgi:tetratricopeptide (TPR) repeat protein
VATGAHRQPGKEIGGELIQAQQLPAPTAGQRDRALGATSDTRPNRSLVYQATGRTSPGQEVGDAITPLAEALKRQEILLGTDHPTTLGSMIKLARAYQEAGRLDQAIPLLEKAYKRQQSVMGEGANNTLNTMNDLAGAYLEARQWSHAETLLRNCLRLRIARKKPDDWWIFLTMSQLGTALARQEKYAEAEPLLIEGYEGLKAREAKIPATRKPELAAAAKRIVPFYRAWGKKDKADQWRAKLAPSAKSSSSIGRRDASTSAR